MKEVYVHRWLDRYDCRKCGKKMWGISYEGYGSYCNECWPKKGTEEGDWWEELIAL